MVDLSAPRFETLVIGIGHKGPWPVDLRVVRDSESYFVVERTELQGPFASQTEARTWCEDNFDRITWRNDLTCRDRESPCPTCNAPRRDDPRVPARVCPTCVLETVDAEGHPVRYYNTGLALGFESVHLDRKDQDHRCWIRGIACWAEEAHFGGIIIKRIADDSGV